MDVTLLTGLVGALVSLLAGYVPSFSEWFDGLESIYKRLIMLGLGVLVSATAIGLACVGYATILGLKVTCDQTGVVEAIKALVAFMIGNQTTYTFLKKSYSKAKV